MTTKTPLKVKVRNDGPTPAMVHGRRLNPGASMIIPWKLYPWLRETNENITAIRDQEGQVITAEQLAAWLAPQEEVEDTNEGGDGADESDPTTTPLEAVSGIGQATAQKLTDRGVDSAQALAALSEERVVELVESGFVSENKLSEWIAAAKLLLTTADKG